MRMVTIEVKAILARRAMGMDWWSRRAAIRNEEMMPEKLVKKLEKARERTVR